MSDEARPAAEPPEDPQKIATGMTLADISIRNHVFAWILMFALIGFGLLCFTGFGTVFKGLGVSQNPDVDFPVVNASISWEGASPEIMETDVVDLVEDAVTSVEGVKEISSSSRQGSANVTVEFELERDIDIALQDVQAKLSQLQRRLPLGIDPPIVSKTNPEDEPIMRIAIGGSRPPTFVADYIRNVVRPQIQTIPGVGEIQLQGFRDRNVRVWYDAVRLEAQGLTVSDVNGAIQREHLEVPAGRIEGADREMNVRAEGEAIDVEDFRNLVITYRNGAPVRLRDVAVVEDGLEDRRRLARTNGQPAVGFGITKLRGANAVQVGRDVRARLAEIEKQLPEGLFLAVNFDTTVFIERAINEILFTLILAALLTSIVCWVFLGSWSTTLNVLLAIPTSILGTFIVMYVFGFTLNTYTVLGLTLVVGIVVDDAIMVLENIYRHREHGEGKVTAASVGAREITFAAAAATLAIMAIFLPVAFMKGIIGKFFFQFGVTITVAVLLSLLEALTLAPMRLSRMLEVGERATRLERWVTRTFARLAAGYQRLLVPALHHRRLVLGGAAVLFVLSLGIVKLLRQEFIPSQDMSRFGLRFQTPVGSSLDTSEKVLSQIERFLQTRPEVEMYGGFVGGFGGGEVNSGFVFVTLKEAADRPVDPKAGKRLSQMDLMGITRQAMSGIPGARIVMQDFSQRGFSPGRGGGFPVEFNIRGPDWDTLGRASREIMEKMRESGLVTDVNSDYQVGMPEVQVVPDRNKAADLGISMAEIGETINSAIGGQRVGKFKDKGRRFDIRVRLLGPQRQRPEDIQRLLVRTGERGARAPGRHRPHRPAAHAPDDHATRPRARDHPHRQRDPRRLAEPRHRALDADRAGEHAGRLPGGGLRQRADLRRVVRVALLRDGARPDGRLHGAGVPVQRLHPPLHGAPRAAVQRQRGARRAPPGRPEHQRLQHARDHPPHGHRQEELDPARGLHQPGPRLGHGAARGAAARLSDPPPAHPHDLDRDDRGRAAARPRRRPRRRAAAADGPLDRGRDDRLHGVHALRRALGLLLDRRRGGVERGAQAPRRGAGRRPAGPADDLRRQ